MFLKKKSVHENSKYRRVETVSQFGSLVDIKTKLPHIFSDIQIPKGTLQLPLMRIKRVKKKEKYMHAMPVVVLFSFHHQHISAFVFFLTGL